MALEIIPVWNAISPALEIELARFWIDHKAMLDESAASERAAQVVCIGREGGAIVGVSTAYPRVVPMLRQPMYYYRNYLAPEQRGQEHSVPFLNRSFAEVEKHELAKEKPLCLGLIVALRNQRLARHYDQAYWPRTKFTFACISPKGMELRVRYFEGIRLPPPSLLKSKAKPAPTAA